jgi:hypothetical protein
MATLAMVLILVATISVAVSVVRLFGGPMDRALARCTKDEAQVWSLYTKFALFVITLKGGLDLYRLETLVGQTSVTLPRCIFEMYRSSAGALWYSMFGLLALFAVTQVLTVVNSDDSTPDSSRAAETARVTSS